MQKINIPEELLDEYGRLLSLDFFWGFTMFMLIAEVLWQAMGVSYFDDTIIGTLYTQLHHACWHGLHFWDLIQPFFMFIVGVAMPIAFGKRWERGASWIDTLKHAGSVRLFYWPWVWGSIVYIIPGALMPGKPICHLNYGMY